jgi:uncharacterized protein YjbI with pentapeptide repeats
MLMANEEHLARLKEAIAAKEMTVWNHWRGENRGILPDLQGADLQGADLQGAHLSEAHLLKVNLSGAILRKADLSGAILQEADLSGAHLWGADLQGADLQEADLSGAFLWGADLSGAILSEADLSGGHLGKANLQGANLQGANLRGADLSGANLRGADLSGANLEIAKVNSVRFNRWTKYRGIRAATCYGSPLFRRFAQDQEFIEEFRDSLWRFPVYLLWLTLADCGRSLLLWTLWCVLAMLGFAYRYWTMGPEAFKHLDLPWQPATAVYYSVITFTTLGFGDIAPKTIPAAMWVMAEVIIGYVMLGGLISIFANKLARRS